MNGFISFRHFRRCFSTATCLQLPRAPPKPSLQPPQATKTSNEGEYVTWRPPNHSEKPLRESKKETTGVRDAPRHAGRQGEEPSSLGTQKPDTETLPRPHRKTSAPRDSNTLLHRDEVSLRWETFPPTPEQLKSTERFFFRHPPQFLWSAEKFKTIDYGNVPEVAFLGRSNVGKSSLLNALLNNSTMARTSSKPGHTRLMNAFSINEGRLILFDMPGYGHASRPEWGVQIMKYLLSRKQFRRAFVLIDALHGPKSSDFLLLDHLGASGVPYQIVLSKTDRLKQHELQAAFDNMKTLLTDKNERRGTSALGEVIGTAGDPAKKKKQKVGMAELRWAVMVAGGLDGSISF